MLVEVLLMLFVPSGSLIIHWMQDKDALCLGGFFCAFECKLDVQNALWGDVHVVPG